MSLGARYLGCHYESRCAPHALLGGVPLCPSVASRMTRPGPRWPCGPYLVGGASALALWCDDSVHLGDGSLAVFVCIALRVVVLAAAAPLIMGNDLRTVSPTQQAILLNKDAIRVNQVGASCHQRQ